MSLADNIHRLTRPHLKTGPNKKTYKTAALLEELSQAITPGNSGSTGGKTGPPTPVNLGAIDLMARIESEAKEDHFEMLGISHPGTLTGLLQSLTTMDLATEWETYLGRATLEYIDWIEAFIWPTKPRRKLNGTDCPACNESKYGKDNKTCLTVECWTIDGTLAPPGEWVIECGGCAASWAGTQVSGILNRFQNKETPTQERLTSTPPSAIISDV